MLSPNVHPRRSSWPGSPSAPGCGVGQGLWEDQGSGASPACRIFHPPSPRSQARSAFAAAHRSCLCCLIFVIFERIF